MLADIQRFARRRLAEAGTPRFRGYLVDRQPKVVDAYLQATVAGLEYPRLGPATIGAVGGADPLRPPRPPSRRHGDEDGDEAAACSITGHAATTRTSAASSCSPPRALAGDDVLVVATTGGPDRVRYSVTCRPTCAWSAPSPPPPAPPRRRHGHQRRLRRGPAGARARGAAAWWRATPARPAPGGSAAARPVVGHGHQPAHRPPVGGDGRATRCDVSSSRPSYGERAQAVQAEMAATDPLGAITAVLGALCVAPQGGRSVPAG